MGVGNWVIAYMLINRAIYWDFWKEPLVCYNRIWAKASLSHMSKVKFFILLLERGVHMPYESLKTCINTFERLDPQITT